jgi:hypothetical protein
MARMLKAGDDKWVEIDDKILDSFTTIDVVLEEMKKRKLTPAETPEDEMPRMPADIGELTPDALGTLYTRLLAWYNFVVSELAVAHAVLVQEKNRLAYVKAKLKKELSSKEEVDIHPLMIKSIISTQEADQRHGMIESTSKVLNKNIATVSRNIELRKISFDGDQRATGIDRGYLKRIKEGEEIRWKDRE